MREDTITPKLSFSTGAIYPYPLSAAFALAKEAGFSGVELVLGPEAIWRGPANTQRLAARYGLMIYSVHAPIMPLPGWMDMATSIGRLVEYAAAMNHPPLVVLHTPRVQNMQQETAGLRYLEALATWRSCQAPVQIALETPGLFRAEDRQSALFDVKALRAFADREGLLLTLDTAHVGSMPYDLSDAYETLRERLVNVHLSDLRHVPRLLDMAALHSYIKHHQLPGQGWLPLERLVRTLLEDDYEGLLTLELSPVAVGIWSPRRVRENLWACVSFVRQLAESVCTGCAGGVPAHLGSNERYVPGSTS